MYKVGIIGCGAPRGAEGATGFGMSREHARGYLQSGEAVIVALADIKLENARAFQAEYGGERIYSDYRQMLADEELDIVSISTWPHMHAPMVIDTAEAGVKAIHCEKPMAPTYGKAQRMVEACERNNVQLTFNHQRRFGAPFRMAKEMLQAGEIGELQRVETNCSNLYDWGTHWFDMMFFYLDQAPAEWVIGQVDCRDGSTVFGVRMEGQGVSHIQFNNGVQGLMLSGKSASGLVNRLEGTEGVIEVGYSNEVPLRVRGRSDSSWRTLEPGEGIHGAGYVERGVLDLVDALKTGREPELAGRRALQATELIFATYESSRKRGRVDLPLAIEDSPLLSMLEAGKLGPNC